MNFAATKVLSALPGSLDPDTIYFVRVGTGFDLYVADHTGAIAYKANVPSVPELPLALAQGGTGKTNAADARTALGVPGVSGFKTFALVTAVPGTPDPDTIYLVKPA